MQNIKFCVGSGDRISFCKNNCVGENPLASQFPNPLPNPPSCVKTKESKIQDYVETAQPSDLVPNIRDVLENEECQLLRLHNLLSSICVIGEREDSRMWKLSKRWLLFVFSFFMAISKNGDSKSPLVDVWRYKTPPRVAVFGWLALRGRVLIVDNL